MFFTDYVISKNEAQKTANKSHHVPPYHQHDKHISYAGYQSIKTDKMHQVSHMFYEWFIVQFESYIPTKFRRLTDSRDILGIGQTQDLENFTPLVLRPLA